MDVRSFLQLDTEQQFRWMENLIMGQNPRLRIGERLSGPIGVFKNGRSYVPDSSFEMTEYLSSPGTVQAKAIIVDGSRIDGHPWLDIDVGDNNFLHLYEVGVTSPFADRKPGDLIDVTYGPARFKVVLTDDIIIDHSKIMVRVAFSK